MPGGEGPPYVGRASRPEVPLQRRHRSIPRFTRFALLAATLPFAAVESQSSDTAAAGRPAVAPPARRRLEIGAALALGLPDAGPGATGPMVTATLGLPTAGRARWLLGVGYVVALPTYARDGLRYLPERIMGAVGREWALGAGDDLGMDLQLNPSLLRTRRWGDPGLIPDPPRGWRKGPMAGSAGLRFRLPNERGPVLALTGRVYSNLSPWAIALNNSGIWSAVGFSVGRRTGGEKR